MIREIKGSVFDQNAEVICHQANCFNRMKSGIAAEIVKRYPEAVEADNRTEPGDKSKLGSYTCGVGVDHVHIINLYGQYNYGTDTRKTDYDALKKALSEFREDYRYSVVTGEPLTVAIPKNMGCGLAGGDWNVVRGIIADLFKDDKAFDILICDIEKG